MKTLNSFFNKIKSIQVIDVYNVVMYLLLFLIGLNFLSIGYVFLLLLILICVFKSIFLAEIKINANFILTLLFSTSFFLFWTLNYGFSIRDTIYYFVFPIGIYIVGQNIMQAHKNKEESFYRALLFLFLGFSLHGTLNMINRFFEFGFSISLHSRISVDIWTGNYISATGTCLYFSIGSALIFPILFVRDKHKKWYDYLFAIYLLTMSVYTSLSLATRSLLMIIVLSFLTSLLIISIKVFKKNKIPLISLLVVMSILILFFVAVSLNIFNIRLFLSKIPLFNRVFKDGSSFIIDEARLTLFENFFKQFYKYPFGGSKIDLGNNSYCHNVWLDTYYLVGVIPFIFILVISILMIKQLIDITLLSKNNFFNLLFVEFIFCMFLSFMIEPIIQGNIYLFISMFFVLGMQGELYSNLLNDYVPKYKGKPLAIENMKIVFISNYLSIHQLSLCNELYKQLGNRFKFIATESFPEKRKQLGGYSILCEDAPYLLVALGDDSLIRKELSEANVIIYGNANDRKYIYPELKKGKLVFKYSERLYKNNSQFSHLRLRSILSQFLHHKRYQLYSHYYLCASAYLPYDLKKFDVGRNRTFKFGYFTRSIEESSILEKCWDEKEHREKFEILFVNRLVKWKHPEKCIILGKYLKEQGFDFVIRIVGSGEKDLEEKLKEEVIKNNLEKNIVFLGPLPNEEVRNLMCKSNAVLATSGFEEGWGACVNEAMQCGTVIVATEAHGSVPFLVSNYENGIIIPFNDDEEMYKAFDYLLNHKDEQYRLSKNASKTGNEVWTGEEASKRLITTIQSISNNEDPNLLYENGPLSPAPILKNSWFKKEKTGMESSKKGSIKKGAILSYLTIILNIILGILYTPWIIKTIGKETYSIYTVAISLTSILAVDFGLSSAVSKFLSEYKAKKEREKENNFMGLIFKLFFLLDALIFVALIILFFFLNKLYGKTYTPEQMSMLKIVYVIVGFYSLISFGSRPFDGILIANEKFTFQKSMNFLQKFLSVVLTILFISLKKSLYTVVLVNSIVGILIIFIRYIYIKSNLEFKPNIKYFDKPMAKDMFKFSMWISAVTICQIFLVNLTPTVISVVNKVAVQITIWSVGLMLEEHVYTLADALNGMFLPKLTNMVYNNEDKKKYTDLMIRVGRIQFMILGLVFVGFLTLGKGFMKLWMFDSLQDDYVYSFYVGIILILPLLITMTERIGISIMIVKNKVREYAIISSITTIVALALNFILAKWLGAVGSAIAILVGRIVGDIVVMNVYFSKKLELDVKKFFYHVHIKLILPLVAVVLVGFLIDYILPSTSWLVLGVKIVCEVLVYGLVLIPFLSIEEKTTVSRLVKKVQHYLLLCNEE